MFFTDNIRNSDMFRITFMGLLKISKPYVKSGLLNTLKFVHKLFVVMIKFDRSSAELLHKMWRL